MNTAVRADAVHTHLRVAVHGSYFTSNFGDTLLVRIMCDWIADRVGSANVFLAVPGHAKEQESIGYPVVSPDRRSDITHLVFTGGGHFGEPNSSLWKKFRWQRRNQRRHLSWLDNYSRAKKAIFGVGVGPISVPTYRRAVGRLFRKAAPIFVRDSESVDYAKKYGLNPDEVRLGTDLALSIPRAARAPDKPFAIHANGLPPTDIEAISDALIDRGMIAPGRPIDIILDEVASSEGVERYREAFSARLPRDRLNIIEYRDPDVLIQLLGRYELIITGKLHVGIVTSALGRKVISIPLHQKTARFYRQLGLQKFCLEGERRCASEIARMMDNRKRYEFDRAPTERVLQEIRGALDEFLN